MMLQAIFKNLIFYNLMLSRKPAYICNILHTFLILLVFHRWQLYSKKMCKLNIHGLFSVLYNFLHLVCTKQQSFPFLQVETQFHKKFLNQKIKKFTFLKRKMFKLQIAVCFLIHLIFSTHFFKFIFYMWQPYFKKAPVYIVSEDFLKLINFFLFYSKIAFCQFLQLATLFQKFLNYRYLDYFSYCIITNISIPTFYYILQKIYIKSSTFLKKKYTFSISKRF